MPPTYEVWIDDQWFRVSDWIWRSWTGRRRFEGVDVHGPVFTLGTNDIGTKSIRVCDCVNCNDPEADWRFEV